MAYRPQSCIFCGDPGKLTREHIWADWLKSYIPKEKVNYEAGTITVNKPGVPDKVVGKKVGGDPHSRRVQCVCARCNSGWMSSLQERAKPIVIPLLQGAPCKISARQQKTLAAWIAMAVMCSEFGDLERIGIPQEDRTILYRHHVPPSASWRIWIGNYERDKWRGHWDHRVLCITQKKLEEGAFEDAKFFNTQSTTYMVGKLFIHAISSTVQKSVRSFHFKPSVDDILYKLWPVRGADIAWPPTRKLSDTEVAKISAGFFDALRRLG